MESWRSGTGHSPASRGRRSFMSQIGRLEPWAQALRGDFRIITEVKSDLMGEQAILCGMLQTGAVLCFDKMMQDGIEPGYAPKLIQYGWETITVAHKHGGITGMIDRLDNLSKLKCTELAEELKTVMRPLYEKHQDDIITGHFSATMMAVWDSNDVNL